MRKVTIIAIIKILLGCLLIVYLARGVNERTKTQTKKLIKTEKRIGGYNGIWQD